MPDDSNGWQFRALARSEQKMDPVQREFFAPQEAAAKLVRESIQNSLDAAIDGKPIRVRFSLRVGGHAAAREGAARFLAGLGPHLEQLDLEEPLAEPAIPYLLVEDFGTRGLTGDPEQNTDPQLPETNSFYWFWRNVGRSGKGGSQRGRWGVGKWVFPATSRISTVFGLTVRDGDARHLLMGHCVLKTHTVDETERAHTGFFASFEEDGFQVPLEDPDDLQQFCAAFGVTRVNESGLSLLIPYPVGDIDGDSLVRAVVLNYFYPILAGELTVEISDGQSFWTVDGSSIADIARQLRWPDADSAVVIADLDLAKWATTRAPTITVDLNHGSGAPRWEDGLLPDDVLAENRVQFEAGARVGLRVEVKVDSVDGQSFPAHFDLWLERDESLSRGRDFYLRDGITVPDNHSLGRGARGMIIVSDNALATLLGDAENPAHTEWREREDAIRNNYRQGVSRVRVVKNALEFVRGLLVRPALGRDETLLNDIFALDDDDDGPPKPRPPRPTPPPGEGAPFTVARFSTGFRVTATKKATFPTTLRVEAAYSVRRGNPFARYDPYDFNLADLGQQITGATARELDANRIVLDVGDENFALIVTGFDPNRDVVVRLSEIGALQ